MNRFALIRTTNAMLKNLGLTAEDEICFGEEASLVINNEQSKITKVTYYVGDKVFEDILTKNIDVTLPYKVGNETRLMYKGAVLIKRWPDVELVEDNKGHQGLRALASVS